MKTIPPSPPPEPANGRKYWRSLDQLAETPEFRQWMEREFPEGASEWHDPVSRRHFVKIMSASFLLAGFGLAGSGCRRPEEKIMPFAKQPEGYVHGQPQYYATAMPTRTGAIPLVVKAHEGRPVKIEGNDKFPGGNGSTDRYAQASILNLYDPDRAQRFTKDGKTVVREEALGFLHSLSQKFSANQGEGLAFLAESSTSPSRARLQKTIARKFPKSQWFTYDAIDSDIHRRAASLAFGKPRRPIFHFDKAKVILSLDCDFLGGEDGAHNHIRKFAAGRKAGEDMSRLYAVESLFTLTGASADHRLRVASSLVGQIAGWIASSQFSIGGASGKVDGEAAKWVAGCAKDLAAAGRNALVVAGQRQPLEVHLLAYAINTALNTIGSTLSLAPVWDFDKIVSADLSNLNSGEFDTLVILGGNPVYNSNLSLKARTIVRLGYYEDETAEKSQWHFPAAHYLESWGDSYTALIDDETHVFTQPLIQPLFGGLTELEFLARIAGESQTSPYDIVRATLGFGTPGADSFKLEQFWKKLLFDGYANRPTGKFSVEIDFDKDVLSKVVPSVAKSAGPSAQNLEVTFFRDAKVDDGRYANNGWMQELPDPITKMVWDNAVLLSRKTASELGVKNGDVVEVSLGGRSVKGPIWIQPGMADYSLGLALGYGREKAGRVGTGVGFNAYKIFSGKYVETGATVRKTGETYTIACTQDHWSMEGRPIVREANLEQFQKDPGFAKRLNMHEPPGGMRPLYPNPLDKEKLKAHHQWGMSIDLNACVGCSACVIACQSENNIPIVGKDQVKRGREMHWIRIDRYYASDPAKQADKNVWKLEDKQQFESWIDDPQVVTQPMLCQHCEAAPCESVCPVNATVHDQEGLNVMAYNRCVGTRYCSNNCPFKVRRFNYFDYNKRPINELYLGPLGKRKDDEWDLIKMIKNPDVTVRMRGVMEKCTFCIQRIEQAKIAQKVKARDSGDVVVPDGTFTTACAQACPAGAIVFGNIADPESRVSKLKRQERDYTVLEFLNIKPRTTYLARVRNPNPSMPDYQAEPWTLKEYEAKAGNPFEAHGAAHGETLPTGHTVEKGGHE